jgi:hypothetical protein
MEGVATSSPENIGLSENELVARAEALIREFPGCFWFRHPEARIRDRNDIPLVIQHLREYGDQRAWRAAQALRKCL